MKYMLIDNIPYSIILYNEKQNIQDMYDGSAVISIYGRVSKTIYIKGILDTSHIILINMGLNWFIVSVADVDYNQNHLLKYINNEQLIPHTSVKFVAEIPDYIKLALI